MTLFVKTCAAMEGFGKPGAIPTIRHNPMDLRHSPHSEHPGDPDAIGVIDSDVDGFADAERQAQLWAARTITIDPKTSRLCAPRKMTVQDAIYTDAPRNENDPARFLAFVLDAFGGRIDAETPLAVALEIQA